MDVNYLLVGVIIILLLYIIRKYRRALIREALMLIGLGTVIFFVLKYFYT